MKTPTSSDRGRGKAGFLSAAVRFSSAAALGLIALCLPAVSGRFNWRENIVLLLLALSLLRPGGEEDPRRFQPAVFILLFFSAWKIALAPADNPLGVPAILLFAGAAGGSWLNARWNRAGRRTRLTTSRSLAAVLVVAFTISVSGLLAICRRLAFPSRAGAVLLLFASSYLISDSSGRRRPFSPPVRWLWVVMPLLVVGINTGRGLAAWRLAGSAGNLDRAGNREAALNLYRRAEELNRSLGLSPIRREWLIAEAKERERMGARAEAAIYLQEAVAAGSRETNLLIRLGDLYLEQGEEDSASRLYAMAGETAGVTPEISRALAGKLIGLGEYHRAVRQLDALPAGRVIDLAGAEQNLELARIYEDRGEPETAVLYLRQARKRAGGGEGSFPGSLPPAAGPEDIPSADPGGRRGRFDGEISYSLGAIYRRLGDLDRAEQYLREALEAAPPVLSAHLLLGRIYEISDPAAARREYRDLVEKLPNHLDGLRRLRKLLEAGDDAGPELERIDSRIAALTPSVLLEADFEQEAVFLGYDLSPPLLKRGEPFTIAYYWKGRKKMAGDYRVYVHFDNALHSRVRFQHDHEPGGVGRPTSGWEPGCVIKESYELSVPPDIPPGNYRLRIGLFDASGDRRNLRPVTARGQPDRRRITSDHTGRFKAGTVIIR